MFNIHQWIQKNLPRNGVIVEAGTADGCDTVWFAQHFNDGRIYGFEPHPSFYQKTCEKVKDYAHVEISPLALSSSTGISTLHLSDLSGSDWCSSSLLKPKAHLDIHPAITFKRTIDVETINLDTWFKSKGSPEVTLLWLDMQGAEPEVLQHAPEILSKTKYLYTEVSLLETYEGVMRWSDFRYFLESKGFQVLKRDLRYEDMGNVLLRNTNYSD